MMSYYYCFITQLLLAICIILEHLLKQFVP